MDTVGERLLEEMTRLGIDSESISAAAKVTVRAQYNYEQNVRKPKTEYWQAVAKIGIDIRFVITGQRASGNRELSINEIRPEQLNDTLSILLRQNEEQRELINKAIDAVKKMR